MSTPKTKDDLELNNEDLGELAKFFDLLQKFDVQDKKAEAEREDKLKD